jgi:hypothetical protein
MTPLSLEHEPDAMPVSKPKSPPSPEFTDGEGVPGIVHIGFKALEGDNVERARYDKILSSLGKFDPRGKPLRDVYCHYFVPESPTNEAWAFDETVHWQRITGTDPRPLHSPFLVLPRDVQGRVGPHWQE